MNDGGLEEVETLHLMRSFDWGTFAKPLATGPLCQAEFERPTEPAQRELTVRSLFIVIFLSCGVAASNTYLGLYVGLTVSASIPSSILAASILRSFGTTPQEINAIQSGTSSGSLVSIGLAFTLPALVLTGYWQTIDLLQSTGIALVGGVLGILFAVILRRAFILQETMTYPEGTASAEIINTMIPPERVFGSPDYTQQERQNRKDLLLLLFGVIVGAITKLGSSTFYLWSATAGWGVWVMQRMSLYIGLSMSPGLASVGYIVGYSGGWNWLIGSVLSWFLFTPAVMYWEDIIYPADADPIKSAFSVWGAYTRYIGIGAMLLGSIVIILKLLKPMILSFRSRFKTYIEYWDFGMQHLPLIERDMPPLMSLCLFLMLGAPFTWVAFNFTHDWYISLVAGLLVVFFGFCFSAVGAFMAGGGSALTPVLGLTLSTVIVTSLIMGLITGFDNPLGPASALLVGAFVCCAVCVSAEGMQDLKAGYMLGSTPWKQQMIQIAGLLCPAILIPLVMSLLIDAYGIGPPSAEFPDPLLAPHATLISDVVHTIFYGRTPAAMLVFGATLGALIIAIDMVLKLSKSGWRLSVLGIALGIDIPIENVLTFWIGSVFAWAAHEIMVRQYPDNNDYVKKNMRFGLMFAEGMITGESLIGILSAIPVVITRDRYFLSLSGGPATLFLPGILLLFFSILANMIVVIYPALLCRYKREEEEAATHFTQLIHFG